METVSLPQSLLCNQQNKCGVYQQEIYIGTYKCPENSSEGLHHTLIVLCKTHIDQLLHIVVYTYIPLHVYTYAQSISETPT